MRVGFVSAWFERGAGYVTKQLEDAISSSCETFIYARGGERYAKMDPCWDKGNVIWGLRLYADKIDWRHFKKWILSNKIDTILFNEQRDMEPILLAKKNLPNIKLGAYVDYYREDSIADFYLYDFLICNTKRHYSVFMHHPQCYYIAWGTNIHVFGSQNREKSENIRFFHSMGMSKRKGTDLLIEAFVEGHFSKRAELIIHSQLDVSKTLKIERGILNDNSIRLIEKTVSAPGLYHLGDVYVYPSYLDGIGLTIYEALASGMPVITTDNPPMNEIITDEVGRLVEVETFVSRSDGYYWPMSICKKDSLIAAMEYYVENAHRINEFSAKSRKFAEKHLNWHERKDQILEAICNSRLLEIDSEAVNRTLQALRRNKKAALAKTILGFLPNRMHECIYSLFAENHKS